MLPKKNNSLQIPVTGTHLQDWKPSNIKMMNLFPELKQSFQP